MKHQLGILLVLLAAAIGQSSHAAAGPDNFDIDIKDLHHGPAAPKAQHHAVTAAARESTEADAGKHEGFSTYTVRPGDHLFLILMRHYGLSNRRAELLIPEVMRLNGIRNHLALTVGQRLTIPLPQPQAKSRKTPHATEPKEPRQAVASPAPETTSPAPEIVQEKQTAAETPAAPATQTAAPLPDQTAPQPPAAVTTAATPEVMPSHPTDTTGEQRITINAAPPCDLANSIAREMGLLVPDKSLVPGASTFTAEYAGITVVVACGLPKDTAYTYERLLARHDVRLLDFDRKESCKSVVEKMAQLLGLSYLPADPSAAGDPPVTYLFPAIGPNSHDIRLTIAP